MTSEFLSELCVDKIVGTKWWRLEKPLVFYSHRIGREIVVPHDFVTDFASVPRLPFAYWFFGGVADAPAAVHDYLYRFPICSRKEADLIFDDANIVIGKPKYVRYPMYYAVRSYAGKWAYLKSEGKLDPR